MSASAGGAMQEQKRGRSMAMTADELDRFMGGQRTARVATVDRQGRPHVTPLWFLWDEGERWISSIVKSSRWTHLRERPEIAIVVDAGESKAELRGVELRGNVDVVGAIPRGTEPHPTLERVERLYWEKYGDGSAFVPDGKHAWLRFTLEVVISWDFRKRDWK